MDILRECSPDIRADCRMLPLRAGLFDRVLMIEVLEHIPNHMDALREVARVMKRNAHFLMTFPNMMFIGTVLRFIKRKIWESPSSEHINNFFLVDFKNMLRLIPLTLCSYHFVDTHFHRSEFKYRLFLFRHLRAHSVLVILRKNSS